MVPAAAAVRMPAASSPAFSGYGLPRRGDVVASGVERDPPGQEAWCQAEVECAVHVAPVQCREEASAVERGKQRRRVDGCVNRLGNRRPPEHDDDRAVATVDGIGDGRGVTCLLACERTDDLLDGIGLVRPARGAALRSRTA